MDFKIATTKPYPHFALCFLILILLLQSNNTKTVQIVKGITVLFFSIFSSGIFGLSITQIDEISPNIVIILILILQPEVRQALEFIGRGNFIRKRLNFSNPDIIMAYDRAIQQLSKRKIGALITIEQSVHLDEFIETGIKLNAEITGELLINIFTPNTPLHDGAVIIRDGKIDVTCAYLPLSNNRSLSKEFGTRHRAALGISEVSDAVTIVISEETGDVSISFDDSLQNHLTRDQYLSILTDKLAPKDGDKESRRNDYITCKNITAVCGRLVTFSSCNFIYVTYVLFILYMM